MYELDTTIHTQQRINEKRNLSSMLPLFVDCYHLDDFTFVV